MELRYVIDSNFRVGTAVSVIPIVVNEDKILKVGSVLQRHVTEHEEDVIKIEAGLINKDLIEVSDLNDITHSVIKLDKCFICKPENEQMLKEYFLGGKLNG